METGWEKEVVDRFHRKHLFFCKYRVGCNSGAKLTNENKRTEMWGKGLAAHTQTEVCANPDWKREHITVFHANIFSHSLFLSISFTFSCRYGRVISWRSEKRISPPHFTQCSPISCQVEKEVNEERGCIQSFLGDNLERKELYKSGKRGSLTVPNLGSMRVFLILSLIPASRACLATHPITMPEIEPGKHLAHFDLIIFAI